jgi:L-asparaginase II
MIRALEGAVVAKSGAEGVYALGLTRRGWGMALKIDDGNPRGVPAIVTAFLEGAGVLTDAARERLARFRQPVVQNTRGVAVGVCLVTPCRYGGG